MGTGERHRDDGAGGRLCRPNVAWLGSSCDIQDTSACWSAVRSRARSFVRRGVRAGRNLSPMRRPHRSSRERSYRIAEWGDSRGGRVGRYVARAAGAWHVERSRPPRWKQLLAEDSGLDLESDPSFGGGSSTRRCSLVRNDPIDSDQCRHSGPSSVHRDLPGARLLGNPGTRPERFRVSATTGLCRRPWPLATTPPPPSLCLRVSSRKRPPISGPREYGAGAIRHPMSRAATRRTDRAVSIRHLLRNTASTCYLPRVPS